MMVAKFNLATILGTLAALTVGAVIVMVLCLYTPSPRATSPAGKNMPALRPASELASSALVVDSKTPEPTYLPTHMPLCIANGDDRADPKLLDRKPPRLFHVQTEMMHFTSGRSGYTKLEIQQAVKHHMENDIKIRRCGH
jgi:hypothetical protein